MLSVGASTIRRHKGVHLARLSFFVTQRHMASTAFTMHAPRIHACEPPTITPPAAYRTDPPPHHSSSDPAKRVFRSPWPSAGTPPTLSDVARIVFELRKAGSTKEAPSSRACTWTDEKESEAVDGGDKVVFTWLGHAACHFRIPVPSAAQDGVNAAQFVTVLTDPVLSKRASPTQFIGPARLQAPPTTIRDMAASTLDGVWPDLLVISHNHYDHLDLGTVKELIGKPNGRPIPHIVCPLGVKQFFVSLGVSESGVTELDWWEQRQVTWDAVEGKEPGRSLRLTCVPAQHITGRSATMMDRNKTLWAGWVMEAVDASQTGKKVYFAGDSGFRALSRDFFASGQPEESAPYCPAFEEIGALFGPLDLAAIPIGAYKPRWAFSSVHMNPNEAVLVHKHVRAKRSVGIHWGTFVLTTEDVNEPAERLKEEVAKQSLDPDEFITIGIGESRSF